MAFQPINFANMPLRGPEDITEGFNAIYGPIAAKRKAEADALAAKLLQMQIKHEPTRYEAEAEYNKARAAELNQRINLFKQLMPEMGIASDSSLGQSQNGNPGMLDKGLVYELFRSSLNLGPESPAAAQEREIRTSKIKSDYEREQKVKNPTETTLTRNQSYQERGIPWLKSIAHLADVASNNMPIAKLGKESTAFGKERIAAAEPTQLLMNFATGESGYHEAQQMLTPSIGESEEQYRARLYHAVSEKLPAIINAYELSGQPVPDEIYEVLEKIKTPKKNEKASSGEKPKNDEKILSTENVRTIEMNKDGLTFDIPVVDIEEALSMGYKIGG